MYTNIVISNWGGVIIILLLVRLMNLCFLFSEVCKYGISYIWEYCNIVSSFIRFMNTGFIVVAIDNGIEQLRREDEVISGCMVALDGRWQEEEG